MTRGPERWSTSGSERGAGGLGDDGMLLRDDDASARRRPPATRLPLRFPGRSSTLRVRGGLRATSTSSASSASRCRSWSPAGSSTGSPGPTQDYRGSASHRATARSDDAARRRWSARWRRLPEHRGAHPRRVPRRPAGARRPVPHRPRRAALPLGDHRHPRDREHAGALGVRTHTRDRHPAGRRHVAPADAALVRWESVVIAVIGGVVGLALGRALGLGVRPRARDEDLTVFPIPVGSGAGLRRGSMLAGVLAAVLPAWRASRLDVLEAIATE